MDVNTTPKPNKMVDMPTGTMERLLGQLGFDPDAKKPSVFTMECPIPEQGNDREYLAHTDKCWLFLVSNSPNDGENKVHAHTNEDHAFVVLQGQARFSGPNGEIAVLRKNQGIMLPRGTFYSFIADNDEPLIMLRIGVLVDPSKSPWDRKTLDGKDVVGSSTANNAVPTVFKPGAFFR